MLTRKMFLREQSWSAVASSATSKAGFKRSVRSGAHVAADYGVMLVNTVVVDEYGGSADEGK